MEENVLNVNFINKTVEKGCTSIQLTPNTVQLNKPGVYMIYCNANVTADAAVFVK